MDISDLFIYLSIYLPNQIFRLQSTFMEEFHKCNIAILVSIYLPTIPNRGWRLKAKNYGEESEWEWKKMGGERMSSPPPSPAVLKNRAVIERQKDDVEFLSFANKSAMHALFPCSFSEDKLSLDRPPIGIILPAPFHHSNHMLPTQCARSGSYSA